MLNIFRQFPAVALTLLICSVPAHGQPASESTDSDAEYLRVVTRRAEKIVAEYLDIADAAKAARVRDIIAFQYRDLSHIHDARDAAIKAARADSSEDKAAIEAQITAIQNDAIARIYFLHAAYLAKLSGELTPEQVNRVKDGMTYGVLEVTYNAYRKMMPDLSDEQKRQIRVWLTEARELAMDKGSSEEKHKVFGKFKGRINNYLVKAGYNLKEAEKNLRR